MKVEIIKKKEGKIDRHTGRVVSENLMFEEVKPDIVLVHGDITITFVTALAAFYLQIPVGHVEAGLRTYNIYSPYPEEFNREAVSIISKCTY